ncbi:uncharacterized protein LTR77_010632 [Saxophila tyrrhenica]|uniref:NADP-dependent oxidoreductase domain-containing protein n=1 Tax=Saxophila tyrrhenica TaxID=1690608 RepID=A0AAV9NUP9_9PEZI|nr:hypothetical protein LTR77_010632 [Saxophila tyrrhenica]
MPARLICGNINDLDPGNLKATLKDARINQLDTAARYKNGESERKIGSANLPKDFNIDTKIDPGANGEGSLAPKAIEKSLASSLRGLGVESVNILYCHAPDYVTPIALQAKAFDEHYRKGAFTHLGVSNFPPSMIEEWLSISEQEGYVKPSVFQGQYNLLCRGYEETLFPLLRKHDMIFNAFSPLAGGFLLANFTADGVQAGSRFAQAANFRGWYDRPSMHEAVKRLRQMAAEAGVGMDELALRWIVYHSALSDKDGVILGASRIQQLENNLAQIKKGPLEEGVVQQLNELWEGVKHEAEF